MRRARRQIVNVALCVACGILSAWSKDPALTALLWAFVAAVNLEWALTIARRARMRRIGGWMKLE